jgi:DNA-binding XRE family transcriptional regulator
MIAIHRPIIQHLLKSMQEWINSFMKNEVLQFSKKLRELRLKKKLSQGDIARTLGVHRSYISGLERGRRNPSLLTIQKIAKAIGISAKELL